MQDNFDDDDLAFFNDDLPAEPAAPAAPAEVGLVLGLSMLLADLVTARFIAQGYHWNVRGINFSEFHEFFGEIYLDYDSAVDPVAEDIRKLGAPAPYLLQDFLAMSQIKEESVQSGEPELMLVSLLNINASLLEASKVLFNVADSLNEQGIADFLAGRIDNHKKWAWQISATLGM